MARQRTPNEDDFENDSDADWDEDGDADFGDEELNDDELPLVRCASCGREMLEMAIQCPHCGEYPTNDSRSPAANRSRLA